MKNTKSKYTQAIEFNEEATAAYWKALVGHGYRKHLMRPKSIADLVAANDNSKGE